MPLVQLFQTHTCFAAAAISSEAATQLAMEASDMPDSMAWALVNLEM